jgi:hypothetical protein
MMTNDDIGDTIGRQNDDIRMFEFNGLHHELMTADDI